MLHCLKCHSIRESKVILTESGDSLILERVILVPENSMDKSYLSETEKHHLLQMESYIGTRGLTMYMTHSSRGESSCKDKNYLGTRGLTIIRYL